MKITTTQYILTLLIICLTLTLKAQSDTLHKIDYFNLDGNFTKFSYYYVDTNDGRYGLFDILQCQVYTTKKIGEKAIVNDVVIAEYHFERKYLRLFYPDKTVYCKYKKNSFTTFLKENTESGKLVARDQLVINGKHPKLYCRVKPRRYKLCNRCE